MTTMDTKEHEGIRDLDLAESTRRRSAPALCRETIGAALKVHTALDPGLLESAYEACLAHELRKSGHKVVRQVVLPLVYDGLERDEGYRLDRLVDDLVVLEPKTVEDIHPIHEAQIISYLKLSKKPLGLILNFKVGHMKDGIKRLVNGRGWN
jgi:GxxExxY protein